MLLWDAGLPAELELVGFSDAKAGHGAVGGGLGVFGNHGAGGGAVGGYGSVGVLEGLAVRAVVGLVLINTAFSVSHFYTHAVG